MTTRSRRRQPAQLGPPRVVLDTHVVLSALVFARSTTAPLRSAWQAGRCVPLVSTVTAQALVRVLAYPEFELDPAEQEELLADYLPFLHLAAAGKAKALVTGDAVLLSLGRVGGCPVITPDAFLSGMPRPEPAGE